MEMKRVLKWLIIIGGIFSLTLVQASENEENLCKVIINFNNEGLNENKEENVECGSTINLPTTSEIVVPSNKQFENWKSGSENYSPGQEVVIDSDKTFYAKYQNIYTISFDMNGAVGVKPKDKTVLEGGLVTPPEYVLAYDFELEGWYKEAECIHKFEFEQERIYNNTTLYAKWVGYVNAYVYDNTNKEQGIGGTISYNNEEDLLSINKEGIEIGTEVSLKAKASKGYHFVRWVENKVDGEIKTEESTLNYTFDRTRTFYAIFEKNLFIEYTVAFESNGGSKVEEQIIKENEKCIEPENPHKNGYIFAGWYTDSNLTSKFDFNKAILNDITLYAKWIKDENAILDTMITSNINFVDFGKIEQNFSKEDSDKLIKKIVLTNVGINTIKITGKNPTNVGPFGTYWWDSETLIEPQESIELQLRLADSSPFANILGTYAGIYRFTAININDENDTYELELPAVVSVSKHHTLRFNTGTEQVIADQLVWDKENAIKPQDPIKENYEFIGWEDEENKLFDFSTPVIRDMNLQAHFEELFTLNYNLQGGFINQESTKAIKQIKQQMTLSYENLITKLNVVEPRGKTLDYVMIDNEKYELNSTYLFENDTTINYVWKNVESTIYDNIDYKDIFDYEFYLSHYEDIETKFKIGDTYDYDKILAHFVTYGMKEGRQASQTFNVYAYQANYVDIYNKYGTEYQPYYSHYLNHGIKERREASALKFAYIRNGSDYSRILNMTYYIDNNSDVATKYKTKVGYNYMGIFNQFLNYGMKEGRKTNSNFDVYIYQANYTDLYNRYGNDLKSYYLHYMNNGYKEGRNATTLEFAYTRDDLDYSKVLDIEYYIENNKDVASKYTTRGRYNYMGIFSHFVNNGMSEGRKSSPTFNVRIYKSNYKDLQDRFKDDYKLYYIHYINYGYKEKRRAY